MSATSVSHGVGNWGLSAAETGIILESLQYAYTHEKGEVFDLTGNTSGVTYFDEKVEISLDGEFSGFSTTMGAELTLTNTIPALIRAGVSGGTVLVEDIQVTGNRKNYQRISVKAVYYPNVS